MRETHAHPLGRWLTPVPSTEVKDRNRHLRTRGCTSSPCRNNTIIPQTEAMGQSLSQTGLTNLKSWSALEGAMCCNGGLIAFCSDTRRATCRCHPFPPPPFYIFPDQFSIKKTPPAVTDGVFLVLDQVQITSRSAS